MFGNWLKTSILMAGIVALFGLVGAAFGGVNGMLLALALGGAMNVFAYWFSEHPSQIFKCFWKAARSDSRAHA
jgi:heat shock protein HtpX